MDDLSGLPVSVNGISDRIHLIHGSSELVHSSNSFVPWTYRSEGKWLSLDPWIISVRQLHPWFHQYREFNSSMASFMPCIIAFTSSMVSLTVTNRRIAETMDWI